MLERFDTATRVPTPWKNGVGNTREIVCCPHGAGLDNFDWRVSIATIAQSGPFSAFAGVDRTIMLLDGDGVELQPASGAPHQLDKPHVPFRFAGDVAMHCTLIGGASTDFNVMTRRSQLRSEVHVLHAATTLPTTPRGLLMVLKGRWQLPGAPTCTPGQGLWWDGTPYGGQALPHDTDTDTDAALVWVQLHSGD
ncbi:MAG: HutD family protein [Hydrogenophaga sp.]|uniref:HutD/Ves family protein n=1 Tax=Hydrogenophaga sp. TaxID=1904254 RepID=UPI002766B6A8|nr:HutD family protein [Hydrogenophaga sp.]MDP2418920.1 HutD family protein [Hydrogenophaga sp.]MDZ4188147.1 HutD family protein [Hydrogenophaga sp.]